MERVCETGMRVSRKLDSSGMEEMALSPASSPGRLRFHEDEEALIWAALEKLPTYDRLRNSLLTSIVDVRKLKKDEKESFVDSVLRVTEEDNEKFYKKLRDRIDRVGIQLPSVEVRFEHLTVEADCYVGNRALPTLINTSRNVAEKVLSMFGIRLTKKRKLVILKDASGIIRPSRMTLLLGPPSSGKTTLLLALAAKLDHTLTVKGEVTYNGYKLNEFVPQKTSVYISQNDVHMPEITVKETLDFSARCQGVGSRPELLTELVRREKAAGILPEAEVDLYMKATAMEGIKNSLQTEYTLKILGLDICKDTIIGDQMTRGISGGQRKRVTTGEMIVGPTHILFMDEISTGLDSSTTYQIVKCLQQIVRLTESTLLMSLLQSAPETFDLFDDIILLSEGQIVYQGPRENVLEFFESCGFRCPERKGTADFLQEVTSKKDQEQYWADRSKPYRYITPTEFAYRFKISTVGLELYRDLLIPFDKRKSHKAALAFSKYTISKNELLKTNFAKEWLLIKRNSFVYISKIVQLVISAAIGSTLFLRLPSRNMEDAFVYMGALSFTMISNMFNTSAEMSFTLVRLPVFYKHRDLHFHPAWAFTFPNFILKIPISIIDTLVWMAVTYYTIGFTPEISRFLKQGLVMVLLQQMASGMFKLMAAICRNQTVASTGGSIMILLLFLLGGFAIPRDKIPALWIWGYWSSPLSYAYNAIAVNEFLAPRWMDKMDPNTGARLGLSVLKTMGVFQESYWFWMACGALTGFAIVFNILFTFALMYLDPLGKPQAFVSKEVIQGIDEDQGNGEERSFRISRSVKRSRRSLSSADSINTRDMELRQMESRSNASGLRRNASLDIEAASGVAPKQGMVLPFTPLAMSFENVNYFVDMPPEMKTQGLVEDRLQLLCEVSGAFRPGVLTALMGVSGAGKTTLMDVLAGRKTGGYIEGIIKISGFPKKQETFARIMGYCEQNDVHSPQITVKESLIYSAFLRLPKEVDNEHKMVFVNEVMELVELDSLKDALVGLPGVTGLSTEQRKRLTIAVELVSNPSIIFMDEPTSGLDARAAAIVMRAVRNTVNTGRTVVCTIHQPSIDIFEAFDELLLMKRGGQVVYMGPLGHNSHKMIDYFEAIPGVSKIKDKYNPATWVLEASSVATEVQLDIDFAEHYKLSTLYQRNKELLKELSTPASGASDLYFPTQYSQPVWGQFKSCLWKQWLTYWRSPDYNLVRMFFTLIAALMMGTIFYKIGTKRSTTTELQSVLGSMTSAVLFIGMNNAGSVQPTVSTERIVFYRERASGMYSPIPYALAQVATEIPYVLFQSCFYTAIIYPMMGFQMTAAKICWFLFISFFTFLYFTFYGMMAIAITPSPQIAAICGGAFYGIFNLFSGFYIPRPRIPKWWVWYYWICPVAWTVYGLILTQYGDIEDMIHVPGSGDMRIKDFIEEYYGYKPDFKGPVAAVLVGFAVLFGLLFTFGIHAFNFQHR